MTIFNRFPRWSQIFPVYAITSIVIYTWTFMWFLWKLPSWLHFLNATEIGIALAYILATNFLESLLVVAIPVFLGFILPRKWFLDGFVSRGSSLVLIGLGYMIYLAQLVQAKVDHPVFSYRLLPIALAAILILASAFLISSLKPVQKFLVFVSDQAIILLYVFIPASIVSIIIVAYRLMFV